MKTKGKTFIVIIAVLIITVAVILVANISSKKTSPGKMGRGDGNANVFTVRSSTLSLGDLHDFIETNGEIESQSSVAVFPDNGGIIAELLVSLGSKVKKGDVIARVDPSAPGMQFSLSPVIAPISGSVVTTPLKRGTTVTQSTTITTLGDIENLQIVSYVPERFVSSLRRGLHADIILEAYPNVVFSATVTRVSPVLDATSRTKEIILTFDKKDDRINAGMFPKVTLFTDIYSGFPIVTENAVVSNDDKKYVFIVKDDSTVEMREVTLGKTVSGVVQLISGVYAGEKIAVEGVSILADGAKVNDLSNPSVKGNQESPEKMPNAKGGKK